MSKRIPPLPALRAFSAFIRLGSIQAAAEDLRLTAGAVSHQIRALEDFLQLTLLDRQGRRMSLTEQGRIYGYQVRQALEDLASATESTARRTHNRSRQSAVRVSVLPSFAQGWLLPRLGAFCRRHPRIHLAFQASLEFVDLSAGTVDCALRFGHGNWPDAIVRPLMGDRLVVVASPRLLGKRPPRTVEQLLRLPLLQAQESGSTWLSTLPTHEQPVERARARLEFTDSTHLLEAARLGLGVALTRRSIADSLIAREELMPALAHECEHTSSYYALLPNSARPSEATEAFLSWLQYECARFTQPHP